MHSTHAYLPAMLSLSFSLSATEYPQGILDRAERTIPPPPVAEECKAAVEGMDGVEWSGGDRRVGDRSVRGEHHRC